MIKFFFFRIFRMMMWKLDFFDVQKTYNNVITTAWNLVPFWQCPWCSLSLSRKKEIKLFSQIFVWIINLSHARIQTIYIRLIKAKIVKFPFNKMRKQGNIYKRTHSIPLYNVSAAHVPRLKEHCFVQTIKCKYVRYGVI